MSELAILGGGNTAFAAAANLALRGHSVTLCEIPSFAAAVDPIRERREIRLEGTAERGTARLAEVTTDLAATLERHRVLLLIVPAYAHRPFMEACVPHLRRGHLLVLMPGTLGTLEAAHLLRRAGRPPAEMGVVLAETDTAPYVCRKTAPDAAHIWGVVGSLGTAALPASAAARVCEALGPLFTSDGREGSPTAVTPYPHVLACGLSAMNPVVHPPGVLMNAGRIERARGDFHFYEEGVTPAVCRVIEALDRERLAIGAALGLDLLPAAEAFHRAGFGPRGDLWATINGSRMLTQLRAPGAVETRWLTEDVPYGIETWAALGAAIGVETPLMEALARLGRAAAGIPAEAGRGLAELGLSNLTAREMLRLVGQD